MLRKLINKLLNFADLIFIKSYRDMWNDLQGVLNPIFEISKNPLVVWLKTMLGIVICWFIYVPIHEFLHVGGCLISGGNVTELSLASYYGATFFKKIFPFIKISNEYAGRLTGFQTNGSDVTYFITVFMPFTLTVLFGVVILMFAKRRKSAFWLGIAVVIAYAPIISITGDYLEMGGILITRLISSFSSFPMNKLVCLRSDDLFKLISETINIPQKFFITGWLDLIRVFLIIFFSQITGIFLAGWTYSSSRFIAHKFCDSHILH